MQTPEEMAAALINTKHLPPGLETIRRAAAEARAYHDLKPYPRFALGGWKVEDRGPLPECMPIARYIVRKSAEFLFSKPVTINVSANGTLEAYLRLMWKKNNMPSRLVAMATNGGQDGGIALKFSFDPKAPAPLVIQSLSLLDDVRLYYDPHNRARLLMARVQYSYCDTATGKYFWYREEWTDAEQVIYKPVAAETLASPLSSNGGKVNADTYEGWDIDSREANPFGVIPVVPIRNIETDDTWGVGDVWGLFRLIDRVNITYNTMDISNQFDGRPLPIFVDADSDGDDDAMKPLQPSQPLEIETREGSEHQAKVQLIESKGSLRPAMMEYAKELQRQLLSAASSVEIDPSAFTNKGNMTVAVLTQLYMPLIEMTTEKRKSWGDNGIALFLATAARGLQNAGKVPLDITDDPDSVDIQLQWSPFFPYSQDELTEITGRAIEQVQAQLLPKERAVERVGAAEGIEDIDVLLKEIADEPAPTSTATDPMIVSNADTLISGLKGVGGKDSV